LKDTLLQLIDINEGKKKEVRLKAFCVCQRELEGTQYKLTTEMAQKSRDSMLLIGARVPADQPARTISPHNFTSPRQQQHP
jgi:hypothetical protein